MQSSLSSVFSHCRLQNKKHKIKSMCFFHTFVATISEEGFTRPANHITTTFRATFLKKKRSTHLKTVAHLIYTLLLAYKLQ